MLPPKLPPADARYPLDATLRPRKQGSFRHVNPAETPPTGASPRPAAPVYEITQEGPAPPAPSGASLESGVFHQVEGFRTDQHNHPGAGRIGVQSISWPYQCNTITRDVAYVQRIWARGGPRPLAPA